MNPRGRRPRSVTRSTERIEFFVTPAEAEQLRQVAARRRQSMSEFIRDAVEEQVAVHRPVEQTKKSKAFGRLEQ